MGLTDRLNPDRRSTDVTPIVERRDGDERRKPFVAAWRRRQIELAGQRECTGGSRFEAVTDTTGAVAL